MALPDKEILEALTSSRILTAMITPAVLISACGTLIFSTSARMGRIFDRINVMKGEVEAVVNGKMSFPQERLAHLTDMIELQRRRAILIHKAMSSLYTATALFVAASLAIAFSVAYGTPSTAWIPTLIALSGVLFLFCQPLHRLHRVSGRERGAAGAARESNCLTQRKIRVHMVSRIYCAFLFNSRQGNGSG